MADLYFGSPEAGSLVEAYINHDLVTFELLESTSEVRGSGVSEFWGHRVEERYVHHRVERASVRSINDDPYDILVHGEEEKYLSACRFRVDEVC